MINHPVMKKIHYVLVIFMAMTLTSFSRGKNETTFSIPIEKYTLHNGLTVILHEDHSDPIAAVAVYYHVGSSRETSGKTGFAHLFEHMMFQRSENVPEDQFFKNIQGAGGLLNGSTNQDRTNYYEVVPKNALEMALWMESDRMGYLENMVTKSALVNQQNVVQNEKRESVDNAPYGFNQGLILKNLYPKGHPYGWTVIGEMQDLTNATVEDVKAFHKKFYSPGNSFLTIAGDFDKKEVKMMVEKYFGEIPSGEKIEKRAPLPSPLAGTVRLYHEDNFAKAPQLTIVFPTAERYSKDSYALNFLGELLAGKTVKRDSYERKLVKKPYDPLFSKSRKYLAVINFFNYKRDGKHYRRLYCLESRQEHRWSRRLAKIIDTRAAKHREYQTKGVFIGMRQGKHRKKPVGLVKRLNDLSLERIERNVFVSEHHTLRSSRGSGSIDY